MAEGLLGHLKAELLFNQSFNSVKHFEEELHTYIRYYERTQNSFARAPVLRSWGCYSLPETSLM